MHANSYKHSAHYVRGTSNLSLGSDYLWSQNLVWQLIVTSGEDGWVSDEANTQLGDKQRQDKSVNIW